MAKRQIRGNSGRPGPADTQTRGRSSGASRGTARAAGVAVLAAVVLGTAILFLFLSPAHRPSETVGQGQVGSSHAELPAPATGRLAPDFTLQTLDGQQTSLSQLRGKPVWINFWATWCPPCQAEMPEMQRKYEALKDKGLVIVGVNFGEMSNAVREFVMGHGFDWAFGLDEGSAIASRYNVTGLPAHFFVDTEGDIKAVQLGGLTSEMMDDDLASILK